MGLGTALRRVWASPAPQPHARRKSNRSHSRPRPPSRHSYPQDVGFTPQSQKLDQERMVIASYRVRVQKLADRIAQKWNAFDAAPDDYAVIVELRELRAQLGTALESYYGALGARTTVDVSEVLGVMEKTDLRLTQLDTEVLAEVGRFETAAADISERFSKAQTLACKKEVCADADDVLIELELYRPGWSRIMEASTRARLEQAYAQLKGIVEHPSMKGSTMSTPWPCLYPPPLNGMSSHLYNGLGNGYGSSAQNGHQGDVGGIRRNGYSAPGHDAYNVGFEGQYAWESYDGSNGFEWDRTSPVSGPTSFPSSNNDRLGQQFKGLQASPKTTEQSGAFGSGEEQREGGSSESGDEGPMRMVMARNRTLRDVAENVMGETELCAPYERPPLTSIRPSAQRVSASDFVMSAPGSPSASQTSFRSAGISTDLEQPNLSQAKHASFASALYYTRHARINSISDAGVLLQRSNVRGDGRCLFRSLVRGRAVARGKSIPSERVEREEADELRERAVAELIKHRDLLLRFFVIEGDFAQYTKRMSHSRTFGGEPELLMLAKLMHVPIAVYILKNGCYRQIQVYGKQYRGEPLRILYSDGVHYDALLVVKR